MKPGDTTTVFVNQGARPATCLATIGIQALIEYTMPAGKTALQVIDIRTEEPTPGRSVSYFSLPTKWLRAIVRAGMDWDGNPQQTGSRRPASPEAMLAARKGQAAVDLEVEEKK